MNAQDNPVGLQLRSTVKSDSTLELSLAEVPVPEPKEKQVLVQIEASPINPSDLGLLFGGADMATAKFSGTADRPVVTADIPANVMPSMKARLDQSLPVGNEGSGTVVAAGSSPEAQALMGKTVAILGGAMYGQYRAINADQCLLMPDGVSAAESASCFVNPLTSQGMVETMRMEGHTALVHTAAASNLGQMLVKICTQDGVDLVNIVRRAEQAEMLKALGAKYVCDSSLPSFMEDLTDALAETGATIAFDATGGGKLACQILTAMEMAANRTAGDYSRYGSTVHKQVYIYGGLDRSPTTFNRAFGMAWSIGGWLLPPFLQKAGPEVANRLRARVAAEIKTTFASAYTQEVSLAGALQADSIATYGKQATSEKFLVCPAKS
jgi:NADPH:quinone reductase